MFSCQRLVWFGSERSNVTSFTGRRWQCIYVQPALGWAERQYVCHGVASHSFVLCLFRPQADRSVISDTNSTRALFRVFSADPKMFRPREEYKIIKTQAAGHMWCVRGGEKKEKRTMHESRENGEAAS